jgi:hypothetical protein
VVVSAKEGEKAQECQKNFHPMAASVGLVGLLAVHRQSLPVLVNGNPESKGQTNGIPHFWLRSLKKCKDSWEYNLGK